MKVLTPTFALQALQSRGSEITEISNNLSNPEAADALRDTAGFIRDLNI
ncbi:MAG: hypothetical protein WBK77_00110 [Alphaproteobacteria bacterium]